ncbi:acetylglutamate kinase [Saliphagus sp. LR7]|uniref:acetylglutamate kinase n=1 Tax=Saliphagus sp. LR7 TaxID=2282654 RepID=UPI000DF8597D|nr:acetylglutamate kinase [Saliphagus sp. LR7]
MKRTFTALLTLALLGTLVFGGLAGTAAAHDHHDKDDEKQESEQGAAVFQQSNAEVTQIQYSAQANVNDGDQTAVALSYQGFADASNSVTQINANSQSATAVSTNIADVDQDSNQKQ